MGGASEEFRVVLNENAVVDDCDGGRAYQLTVFKARRAKDDVVGLPFTGLAARIDQWWVLAVDATGLTVGVGQILKTI